MTVWTNSPKEVNGYIKLDGKQLENPVRTAVFMNLYNPTRSQLENNLCLKSADRLMVKSPITIL